jgi:parallel beta-helix repeat protein
MYGKLSLVVVVLCTLLLGGIVRAAGLDVTQRGDIVWGVPNDGVTNGSENFGWPGHEHPGLAIDDNTSTKYLHFKGEMESTGFQVTPSARRTVVVGLTFTTANDAVERDPVAFELYGSSVSINGPYTLIASGDIVDFSQATPWPRQTKNETPIFFDNDVAYNHYQVLFPAVRDPGRANSMQISEVELLKKASIAMYPNPADGAVIRDEWVRLSWLSGDSADSHDVYFGENFRDVSAGTGGTFRGNQFSNDFLVGLPGCPYPDGLVPDTTYYWRIDEFDGAITHKGDVWSFTVRSEDTFLVAYYVDGSKRSASDNNPGTEDRPFKTIGRGVQSLQPGEGLLIKAGTYRESVILTRSGTEANPIRIQAYPGDEGKVIINAAEPVTNWRKCAGPDDCDGNPSWEHIYVADVATLVESHSDSAFAIRQVFQYGQLLKRSRYPDEGWRYPTSITDPRTRFIDTSLNQPDSYFVGSVCHIQSAPWRIDQIPVTSFSRGSVTLVKSPWYDISMRFGYYFTSVVGEINEEGEWAYDPARKKIFLWPIGDVAEAVEFTYRDYCVRTYANTNWNVINGLVMRNAYRDGIWLYRANNMTIENNTIEYAFNFGIHLQSTGGFCNDNEILRNTIRYSGYRGINVGEEANRCNIEGNFVFATGVEHYGGDLMNGPSEGIYVFGPSARVYNNRIDCVGNVGLYLHGGALDRDVSYNYITNTGLALSDTGGIYTGGVCEGRAMDFIHHNIIEDSFGCKMMDRNHDKGLPVTIEKYSGDSSGIYVDERGNNRIIEHKTVINAHMAGIFFHWAPANVVQNNTLYGNKKAQIWFSGRDQPGDRLVDEVVLDNIMFATEAQQKTFYLGINYNDVHFGQSDRNYFYNPFSNWNIFVSRYSDEWIEDYLSLQRWHALSGYDANSKEFRYLNQLQDITIDSKRKSRIVYNPSLDVIEIDLGSEKYCDVNGNKVCGTVNVEPFESKVLIPCDF